MHTEEWLIYYSFHNKDSEGFTIWKVIFRKGGGIFFPLTCMGIPVLWDEFHWITQSFGCGFYLIFFFFFKYPSFLQGKKEIPEDSGTEYVIWKHRHGTLYRQYLFYAFWRDRIVLIWKAESPFSLLVPTLPGCLVLTRGYVHIQTLVCVQTPVCSCEKQLRTSHKTVVSLEPIPRGYPQILNCTQEPKTSEDTFPAHSSTTPALEPEHSKLHEGHKQPGCAPAL